MKEINCISVRPKRWWMWITQWRQIRNINRVINYMWKKQGLEKEFAKAQLDLLLYGNAFIKIKH